MKKFNIKEILTSNETNQIHIFYCLIARPQKKISKNNTPFLNLYLVDQTGEINAKK
ncbi:MAG: hypothetical protein QJQ54_02970 [Mollicutes bacterium]|nr:MAG: hypothetical protein QJQ54_02970 [Mollicutes bacterium]